MEALVFAAITLVAGFLIGCICGAARANKRIGNSLSGTLVLDYSESPNRPLMYVSECVEPNEMAKAGYASFKVSKVN